MTAETAAPEWSCGRCRGSGVEDPFDGLHLECVRCDGLGIDPDYLPDLCTHSDASPVAADGVRSDSSEGAS